MKITIACHLLPSRLAIMVPDNIQVENMEEHEFFVYCQGLWQRKNQIQTDRRIVEDSWLQSWTRNVKCCMICSHFTPRYEVLTNRNMHKGTHSRRYMQKYSWQQYSWRHTKRKTQTSTKYPPSKCRMKKNTISNIGKFYKCHTMQKASQRKDVQKHST